MENVGNGLDVWRYLGDRVRDLRLARRWTQARLAEELAIYGVVMHQTTVAKLEGATRPTVAHELWALAMVFEVDYRALLPMNERDAGEFETTRRALDRLQVELLALDAERLELKGRMQEVTARQQLIRAERTKLHRKLRQATGEWQEDAEGDGNG